MIQSLKTWTLQMRRRNQDRKERIRSLYPRFAISRRFETVAYWGRRAVVRLLLLMILERLGIGFQIERNLCLSLSQIPTVEEEEQRGRRKEVSGSFFWETCVLCRLRKKRGERERRTVEFLQISDHDSHYSYSFLSHKLQSSPSIIPEVQIFV